METGLDTMAAPEKRGGGLAHRNHRESVDIRNQHGHGRGEGEGGAPSRHSNGRHGNEVKSFSSPRQEGNGGQKIVRSAGYPIVLSKI